MSGAAPVPDFLAALPRWVLWREETRGTKATKVPFSAVSGTMASSTDGATWTSRDRVVAQLATRPGLWAGEGVVLGDLGDGEMLAGIDLDTCLDDEAVESWARPYVRILNTYGEVSPSGTGIKLFFRFATTELAALRQGLGLTDKEWGRKRVYGLAPPGEAHPPAAEIYTAGRYFTVTGRHWHECAEDVALVSRATLEELVALFGPRERRTAGQGSGEPLDATAPDDVALADKLREVMAVRPWLADRYNGDLTGLGDTTRSSLDMSLGAMLKAAGFSYAEMRAVLISCPYGAAGEHAAAGDERYFQRIWERTVAEPRQAPEPPPEQEGDPGWEPPPNSDAGPQPGGRNRRSERDGKKELVWGDPVDFLADDSTGAPELRPDHVPKPIYDLALDTAARLGIDPVGVAMGALTACATVTSDGWRLQPKRQDYTWTEQARIWFGLVGDPSILKTPALRECLRPVERMEIEARRRHTEGMRAYKVAHAEWKAAKDASVPEPSYPKLDRYVVESATIEALQEVLRDDDEAKFRPPAGKVLVYQDEMSEFFANLDRYKGGGKGGGDRGAHLRLYNGGRFTVDRIGRGSFAVTNWSGCFMGGIQPGPIQDIASQATEDGLLQRFLYCVPSNQRVGADRPPDQAARERYGGLVMALAALYPPTAIGSDLRAHVTLAEGAHQHREEVNDLARALSVMPDTSKQLKAALGKWPGLFARLCLIFHLIGVGDANAQGTTAPFALVVQEATARQVADFMLDIVLPHLLRAHTVMYATSQTGHARWIAGHILAGSYERITVRDVVRAYGPLRAPDAKLELVSVMESLVAVGWLEPELPENPAKPIHSWKVNPNVHGIFAARAEAERVERERAKETLAQNIEKLRRRRDRKKGGSK